LPLICLCRADLKPTGAPAKEEIYQDEVDGQLPCGAFFSQQETLPTQTDEGKMMHSQSTHTSNYSA
jgi:hypothetical protein